MGLDTATSASGTLFKTALKIFIVIGTLFYLGLGPQDKGIDPMQWNYHVQEVFFRYGAMLIFLLSIFLKPRRYLQCKSLATFAVFALVVGTLTGFPMNFRRQMLNLAIGILFYKAVYENIDTAEVKQYAEWMFWLLFANLVLGCMQWFRLDPIFNHVQGNIAPINEHVVGFMRLRANLGVLTAITAPMLFAVHPLTTLIALPLMWWGMSSASVGAFVISLGFLLYFRLRRWGFYSLFILVAVAGAYFVLKYDMPGGQFDERFKIWFVTASAALKNAPFMGLGLGKFSEWLPLMMQKTVSTPLVWAWAHNEFIQVFFEMGIAGFVMLIAYIRGRFSDFFGNPKNMKDHGSQALFACFMSVLFVSFFHFPFHVGKLAGICVFIMAFSHAKSNEAYDEKDKLCHSTFTVPV